MPTEENKALVRRYFEALDKRDAAAATAMFSVDCLIHRPDVPTPLVGHDALMRFLDSAWQLYPQLSTTIHDLICEEDRVAARLSHRAMHATDWTTRLGVVAAAGKPVTWNGLGLFRIENRRIAEQWVVRDEVGMLHQLGATLAPRV